jgi:hypothetical protein
MQEVQGFEDGERNYFNLRGEWVSEWVSGAVWLCQCYSAIGVWCSGVEYIVYWPRSWSAAVMLWVV